MWVAAAGPGTNLGLAIIMTILLHVFGGVMPVFIQHVLAWGALINIVLMIFNLLPIPPLDGSRIVARFLEGEALVRYMKLERYGLFIVFGLLWFGVLSKILQPVIYAAVELLQLSRFLL